MFLYFIYFFLNYSLIGIGQNRNPCSILNCKQSNGTFPLHGTVQYGSLLGGFPLGTVPGTFLVPPRLGFQAIRTVTKTWRVNSTDHWLAGENRHYCVTELATRDPTYITARFKSAQPAKDRTTFVWTNATFCINPKFAVSLSVEEVQTFLSLIAEERIQRELDGATRNEKALWIYFLHFVYF